MQKCPIKETILAEEQNVRSLLTQYRSLSVFTPRDALRYVYLQASAQRFEHTATHCSALQHTATHCNTYVYLQASAQRFEPKSFHRTKEVSNNFCVSLHITHISMAISANLGRDTEHNSTKLVRFHPLGAVWCSTVQCVAVCCSVLQCVAVCCSVLQHMNTSHPTPSSL